MKGWKYEGYRHSLAAKGIKTSFAWDETNPQFAQKKFWEDQEKERQRQKEAHEEFKRVEQLKREGKHKEIRFHNGDDRAGYPQGYSIFTVSEDKDGNKFVEWENISGYGDRRYTKKDLPEINKAIEGRIRSIERTEAAFRSQNLGHEFHNEPTEKQKAQGAVNVVGSGYFTEFDEWRLNELNKLKELVEALP